MSSFVLKIIAIIAMFFDHAGYAIYGKLSWCNYIGRLAFPIFAFQITEGYRHTKNLKKYFFRLILFALISQIPIMMLYSVFTTEFVLNIFFTLFLGLLAVTILDKQQNKFISITFSCLIVILAKFLKVDYSAFGVLIIICFYLLKNKKIALSIVFSFLTIYHYKDFLLQTHFRIDIILLVLFSILSLVFIFLYNGKKGKNIKLLFYWFYPIHLVLLYLINIFFFNKFPNCLDAINHTINYMINSIQLYFH